MGYIKKVDNKRKKEKCDNLNTHETELWKNYEKTSIKVWNNLDDERRWKKVTKYEQNKCIMILMMITQKKAKEICDKLDNDKREGEKIKKIRLIEEDFRYAIQECST